MIYEVKLKETMGAGHARADQGRRHREPVDRDREAGERRETQPNTASRMMSKLMSNPPHSQAARSAASAVAVAAERAKLAAKPPRRAVAGSGYASSKRSTGRGQAPAASNSATTAGARFAELSHAAVGRRGSGLLNVASANVFVTNHVWGRPRSRSDIAVRAPPGRPSLLWTLPGPCPIVVFLDGSYGCMDWRRPMPADSGDGRFPP